MMLDKIIDQLESLDQTELRILYNHIGSALPPSVVYQHKPSKCGCKKCKEGGPGHGKYWYAYFSYDGKTHCVYIGKEKREIDPIYELELREYQWRKKDGVL
ncbi:MAG: hypothetical protein DHS20C13_14360 [Thermodesulfobacteriota bacterium]|nr:MAG: hypothetical protein DHS20C13_14360 [Thermodesulfobacteriota bacterium]